MENRIKKVEKMATTGGDKEAKKLLQLLVRYREALLQGKSCRTVVPENADQAQMAHDLFLLTNKPVMYVCNVDEASAASGNAYVEAVRAAVADEQAEILVIAAKTEAEIAEIEEFEDRQMFLEEMGLGGRRRRMPGVDHRGGGQGAPCRRGHPYGLRAGLHPRRSYQIRGLCRYGFRPFRRGASR